MGNIKIAAVSVAATAALLLIVGAGYSYGPGTAATLSLNRTLTAPEAGKAMGYQCIRDFHQCLQGIPASTYWSTNAYQLEQTSCCGALAFCADLTDDLNGRLFAPLDKAYDDACTNTIYAEGRRESILDALRAASAEQGLQIRLD